MCCELGCIVLLHQFLFALLVWCHGCICVIHWCLEKFAAYVGTRRILRRRVPFASTVFIKGTSRGDGSIYHLTRWSQTNLLTRAHCASILNIQVIERCCLWSTSAVALAIASEDIAFPSGAVVTRPVVWYRAVGTYILSRRKLSSLTFTRHDISLATQANGLTAWNLGQNDESDTRPEDEGSWRAEHYMSIIILIRNYVFSFFQS